MDSKSSELTPKRKRLRLQLASSTLPTWRTPERSLEGLDSISLFNDYRTTSSRPNFKISPDCGPFINLEDQLLTRSQTHQSRVKSASIKLAIKYVYKYHARSISELYNMCTSDEWASLTYLTTHYNNDIQVALELYIKDNLDYQRRDRWEWLISYQSFLPDQEYEILNCLCANNIDPVKFMTALRNVLLCADHKKNCLHLWGISDSGKSLIAQLICKNFVCAYANNHGSEQEFFFSNFLNKSVVLCEEIYVTTATVEDYKSILGGALIDLSKKFNEKQLLTRTPIILTSNYKLFGRGHLNPVDEGALQNRCYSFEFTCTYKPKCTVTAPALAHLMHYLYNKDILD
uniref:Nonstructural protein 1 n=1 Tax=Phylloscopus inornatus densovirus TaxID=2794547 RepID=A0A8A4XCR5_9VIRU|nr:MAG: nonstructural protein 1 [Phylloscopus inornatus densovirus]